VRGIDTCLHLFSYRFRYCIHNQFEVWVDVDIEVCMNMDVNR
jgi:hypothetical protein